MNIQRKMVEAPIVRIVLAVFVAISLGSCANAPDNQDTQASVAPSETSNAQDASEEDVSESVSAADPENPNMAPGEFEVEHIPMSPEEAEKKTQETLEKMVHVGEEMPDFELKDTEGNAYKLSDYRGKRVILVFWASWCPDCARIMPAVEKLYQDEGKNTGNYIVLSLVNPHNPEDEEAVDMPLDQLEDYLAQQEFERPVLLDTTGQVFDACGISAFPTVYALDENGVVVGNGIEPSDSQELMEILTYDQQN